MMDFKRIMFPVDFSEASEMVFPHALTLARKNDATLHLFHVVRDLAKIGLFYVPGLELSALKLDMAAGADKKMEEYVQRQAGDFKDVRTSVDIVTIGDEAEEIVKFAKENDMDLVVMPTHGRKGLAHAFLGSVTERVIRNSPIPVMVVNPFQTKPEPTL
ncbi:MAG: universal stress protein [Thermodesulfobacteriota bacterium]